MKKKNCLLTALVLSISFRLLAQCDYEKSNNTIDFWDWRQEYYSDIHFGQETPNCIGPLGMRSPFYPPSGGSNNINLQIFYNQYTDANNISSVDCQPVDGWELLAKEFGSSQDPAPTPFFCLYNRYTGLVRAFFLVTQSLGLQNGASIKMSHLTNTTGRESAIFSHLYPVTKPVQEFIKNSKMTNLNYYLNNECYWLYADFPIAYDPCVCFYESKIVFECNTISTMDVKLSGTINGYLNQIVGTTSGNVTGKNNIFDLANSAVKSGNKSYGSWEKTAKGLEEFAKKQEIDVETQVLFGAFKLKNLFTAIPYLGAAFGVLEYFQGLGKPAGTGNSTPLQFGSNLEFQGIGTIQQSNPIGTRIYWTPGSNQNAQTEKTLYDNPLGVVSILSPIAIEWIEYQYIDQPTYLTPTMVQYKIANPVKYALNPSANVEVIEIQASLVMRYKAMPIGRFNTLFNSYAPYGVTFPRPVGFINTPKFTDKINSVGLETELFAYNTNKDSVIVSLRTPYVPLSCFHNTSVFMHGYWGDDAVELITKFIIKVRPIDQPEKEILFLQSYFPNMFNNEEPIAS
jgi:hypothetical protein